MAVVNSQRKLKIRLRNILIIFVIGFMICVVRTAFLQFVQGEMLKTAALEQQTVEKEINPRRGTIFDRNGKGLAISANVETVIASPDVIYKEGKTEQTAEKLASILGMEKDKILKIITRKSKFEYVKKRIEKEMADKIRDSKLKGISLVEDTKRYYPFSDFASHIIGFTGEDNQGLEGVESTFDKYLKGKKGKIVKGGTTRGDSPIDFEKYNDAEDGNNIVLTIDEVIQHIVEKHLKTAYIENKIAKGGCAIVIQPNTGEILAMATYPNYDLNKPREILNPELKKTLDALTGDEYNKRVGEELQKQWRNKAVVDTYEPGSTFKVLTAAMALEEKVVSLEDHFNCGGSLTIGGRNISCWKPSGHGTQTFRQGLVNSCNPVLMQVGAKIGKDSFYKYTKLFGLRETTDFDLPGEAVGPFHDLNNFNEVELATSSFGQSFQITPLQLITAISSLINGGNMFKPHVVKQITDSQNHIIKSFDAQAIRQTVSKSTSDQIRDTMEHVVVDSGGNAAVKGYRIGGKSGTSEKLPRGSGKYIASFVGFAPVDDPKVLVLVILDEPNGDSFYGGVICAPVIASVIEETMRYYGVEPKYTEKELASIETTVPDIRGKDVKEAEKLLNNFRLNVRIVGEGGKVIEQMPKPYVKVMEKSTVNLYTDSASIPSGKITVPDVTRKTALEANDTLTGAGLNISIKGNAYSTDGHNVPVVYKQDPPVGTQVDRGSVVTVEFRTMGVE